MAIDMENETADYCKASFDDWNFLKIFDYFPKLFVLLHNFVVLND